MIRLPIEHWATCPTFVTNFKLDKLESYNQAIKLCGDPGFVICEKPMLPMTSGYSLHHVKNSDTHRVDVSGFIDAIRQITGTAVMFPSYTAKLKTKMFDPIKAYDKAMKGI